MEYFEKPVLKSFSRYCKTLGLNDDKKLIGDYKKVHANLLRDPMDAIAENIYRWNGFINCKNESIFFSF